MDEPQEPSPCGSPTKRVNRWARASAAILVGYGVIVLAGFLTLVKPDGADFFFGNFPLSLVEFGALVAVQCAFTLSVVGLARPGLPRALAWVCAVCAGLAVIPAAFVGLSGALGPYAFFGHFFT